MRGPITEANPVGVEYEPEQWLEHLQSGGAINDLLIREVHEPVSPIRGQLSG
jgi:hypothetical protein